MTAAEVHPVFTKPTRYDVSCIPIDHDAHEHFNVTVEHRGPKSWAVLHGGYAFDIDGDMDYEPRPSGRTDEWKETHRFDLETALALAEQVAPKLTINGLTVTDVLSGKYR